MEVPHQPCHFCSSSDAFSYNTETGMFRCFSCGATPKNKRVLYFGPEDIRPLSGNTEGFSFEEGISLEPYYRDYRGIKAETLEAHGGYFTKMRIGDVAKSLDYNNPKHKKRIENYEYWRDQGAEFIETVHWQYPNATKHRELPKLITISGNMDKFFGQDEYTGGKTITITEGEEDRLSVIEIMGEWPCVSVPAANPSVEFWKNARDYLANFEKIVLSVDNDEPGNLLAQKFFRIFPGKVYRVSHGEFKDANDFIWDKENGVKRNERQNYKSAWFNAPKMKPDGILSSGEDFVKLYKETPNFECYSTGIEGLDKLMLGIHKGAFTLILAPTGVGKTEFMRYLEHRLLTTTDYTLAACHGEETRLRSLLGLVSYDLQDNLTRKDLIEAKGREKDVEDALMRLGAMDRFNSFQLSSSDSVDDIVDKIRFLSTGMGCDYVFFEPCQDYVSGSIAEKESQLTDMANKLKLLASEVNVGIVVIAHANEDGDAKYCKSLVQSAAYEITLERDQKADEPDEKNLMKVHVGRKNRTGGGSGYAGTLRFEVDTYMLTPELGPVEPPTPQRGSKKTEAKKEDDFDEIPF